MPADSASAGSRIDHYLLERRLALGGMAEIFLAKDERSGRVVALKRILPQIANESGFLDRFFHEIRIQISLKHRNVVELVDCSPAAEGAYIVMEFIDGGALNQLRERVGRFPWEIALYVAGETLQGLGAAHKKGIVHRDVKPQNIMWTMQGAVKIADFGISQADHLTRLTVTGTVVGTPSFMSPEQARGESLDARSDIFSIGTVLYEMLTGLNPFTASSVTSTLRQVVDVLPTPPSFLDPNIPASVDAIMARLHAKNRERRFASTEEAEEAIRAVLAEEGVSDAAALFRTFISDPSAFVLAHRREVAEGAAAEASKLLEDSAARPEDALWAAYRTLSVSPEDPAAKTLYKKASERIGQRETPIENARIKDLEEKLKADPDNVALLLQLAKLYRLEKDFVNLMRFFRKLQVLAPRDAYTQSQIAALVGAPASPHLPGPGSVDSTASRRTILPPPPEPEEPVWPAGRILGVGALALVAVIAVWLLAKPRVDISAAGSAERQRADAFLKLLKGSTVTGTPLAIPEDDALQKVLEKGALLEKNDGPARALPFYREALARTTALEGRAILLFTIMEAAAKAGNRPDAIKALDEVIASGSVLRSRAMLKKAELLEAEHDEASARRMYDELLRGNDAPAALTAGLRLAMLYDRAGDVERALPLYEEIVVKAPGSPEANPARLGAGALYRALGRNLEARHMFEDVKQSTTPGSDFDRSADSGLKSLE